MGFIWWVSSKGYRWKEGAIGEQVLRSVGHEFRDYEPLKEFTGLFRTLANNPQTPAGILAFANKYGQLDASDYIGMHAIYIGQGDLFAENNPKGLEEWQESIETLRRSVSLWDDLRA